MESNFDDKVILITGGTSGMGEGTALHFAHLGAKIVICGRNTHKGDEVIAKIKKIGGSALFINCDVSKELEVKILLTEIIKYYGKLDYAFNNAGVSSKKSLLADLTEDNWDSVLNTNLKGIWLSMKYEIIEMLKLKKGVIINNSSGAGILPIKNISAYVASKFGVNGLTRAAAIEYAEAGIRINAICPGYIDTPMTDKTYKKNPKLKEIRSELIPMKRTGKIEDIVGVIEWLCSDAAAFITGAIIPIDGGSTAGFHMNINV